MIKVENLSYDWAKKYNLGLMEEFWIWLNEPAAYNSYYWLAYVKINPLPQ